MARIIVTKPAGFTGHIGQASFSKGEGETDIPSLVAYFERHPDRFEVHHDPEAEAETPDPDGGGTPPPEPDLYDDLTDEQVAEAYATNVAGNATTRKGQLKALRKLDADAQDSDESTEDDDTQE